MSGPLHDVIPMFATLDHPVWEEIHPELQPHEFEDPEKMDVSFLRMLYAARIESGVPFRIIDTLRDDSRSAHGEEPGIAADLQTLNSRERFKIIQAALKVGFERIGVYRGTDGKYKGQTKKDGGGVHLDASRHKSSEHMWTKRLP